MKKLIVSVGCRHQADTMEHVNGNIINAKEILICHQGNCVTHGSAGVATIIFNAFPYSNCYSDGTQRVPGQYCLRAPKTGNGKHVLTVFGQYQPGRPKHPDETAGDRLVWFRTSLDAFLTDHRNYRRIAIPHGIGCGLAGGRIEDYERVIADLARKHGVTFVVYKYDNTSFSRSSPM